MRVFIWYKGLRRLSGQSLHPENYGAESPTQLTGRKSQRVVRILKAMHFTLSNSLSHGVTQFFGLNGFDQIVDNATPQK